MFWSATIQVCGRVRQDYARNHARTKHDILGTRYLTLSRHRHGLAWYFTSLPVEPDSSTTWDGPYEGVGFAAISTQSPSVLACACILVAAIADVRCAVGWHQKSAARLATVRNPAGDEYQVDRRRARRSGGSVCGDAGMPSSRAQRAHAAANPPALSAPG